MITISVEILLLSWSYVVSTTKGRDPSDEAVTKCDEVTDIQIGYASATQANLSTVSTTSQGVQGMRFIVVIGQKSTKSQAEE